MIGAVGSRGSRRRPSEESRCSSLLSPFHRSISSRHQPTGLTSGVATKPSLGAPSPRRPEFGFRSNLVRLACSWATRFDWPGVARVVCLFYYTNLHPDCELVQLVHVRLNARKVGPPLLAFGTQTEIELHSNWDPRDGIELPLRLQFKVNKQTSKRHIQF